MAWDDEDDLDVVHFQPQPESTRDAPTNLPDLASDGEDADVLGVDDEITVKPRRVQVKLDEDKLMHPAYGIPYLQSRVITKLLPRIGKAAAHRNHSSNSSKSQRGNELKDLTRILQFYQLWTHKLYPKANFADFISLARNVGKRKRMRVWRSSWIDDEKAGRHGVEAEFTEQDPAAEATTTSKEVSAAGVNQQVQNDPDSLFMGDDNDQADDDFDNDISVTSHHLQSTSVPNSTTPVPTSTRPSNPFLFDEDDDEGLYDKPSQPPIRQPTTAPSTKSGPENGVPDEDELDELMGLAHNNPPSDEEEDLVLDNYRSSFSKPPGGPSDLQPVSQNGGAVYDDDDLNDIFSDSEDAVMAHASASASTSAGTASASTGVKEPLAPPAPAASTTTMDTETVEDFEQDAFDSVQDLGF